MRLIGGPYEINLLRADGTEIEGPAWGTRFLAERSAERLLAAGYPVILRPYNETTLEARGVDAPGLEVAP
jgi:hypothetical protein